MIKNIKKNGQEFMISNCPLCGEPGTAFAVGRFDYVTIYFRCDIGDCDSPVWVENAQTMQIKPPDLR